MLTSVHPKPSLHSQEVRTKKRKLTTSPENITPAANTDLALIKKMYPASINMQGAMNGDGHIYTTMPVYNNVQNEGTSLSFTEDTLFHQKGEVFTSLDLNKGVGLSPFAAKSTDPVSIAQVLDKKQFELAKILTTDTGLENYAVELTAGGSEALTRTQESLALSLYNRLSPQRIKNKIALAKQEKDTLSENDLQQIDEQVAREISDKLVIVSLSSGFSGLGNSVARAIAGNRAPAKGLPGLGKTYVIPADAKKKEDIQKHLQAAKKMAGKDGEVVFCVEPMGGSIDSGLPKSKAVFEALADKDFNKAHNITTLAEEVQSSARTTNLFAHQTINQLHGTNWKPDIVVAGKALTNGSGIALYAPHVVDKVAQSFAAPRTLYYNSAVNRSNSENVRTVVDQLKRYNTFKDKMPEVMSGFHQKLQTLQKQYPNVLSGVNVLTDKSGQAISTLFGLRFAPRYSGMQHNLTQVLMDAGVTGCAAASSEPTVRLFLGVDSTPAQATEAARCIGKALHALHALQPSNVLQKNTPAPLANYVATRKSGNQIYVSGQLPRLSDGTVGPIGKVGESISPEQAKNAARSCAQSIYQLATQAAGNKAHQLQCVSVSGFVNATPDFIGHSQVMNGASDFLMQTMGEKGKHARFAVGAASLPMGVPVEVAATFSTQATA